MQASFVALSSPCTPITAAVSAGRHGVRASARALLRRASSQFVSRSTPGGHSQTQVLFRQISTSIPEPARGLGRQWRGLRGSSVTYQRTSAVGNTGIRFLNSAVRAVVTAPAPAPIQEGNYATGGDIPSLSTVSGHGLMVSANASAFSRFPREQSGRM